MDLKQTLEKMQDKIISKASVEFVFGNVTETKGKSIIPVSAIKYSLGGGEGKGPDLAKIKGISQESSDGETTENRPKGEGLGGRFSNQPLGVFEITDEKTRFIPVIPVKAIIVMVTIWIVTRALGRKRK